MNELEAKCYLTKQGGANNSDHTCMIFTYIKINQIRLFIDLYITWSFYLWFDYCRFTCQLCDVFRCNSRTKESRCLVSISLLAVKGLSHDEASLWNGREMVFHKHHGRYKRELIVCRCSIYLIYDSFRPTSHCIKYNKEF